MSGLNIMVVTNSYRSQQSALVGLVNHKVFVVSEYYEALNLLQEQGDKIDVVLCDFAIPSKEKIGKTVPNRGAAVMIAMRAALCGVKSAIVFPRNWHSRDRALCEADETVRALCRGGMDARLNVNGTELMVVQMNLDVDHYEAIDWNAALSRLMCEDSTVRVA